MYLSRSCSYPNRATTIIALVEVAILFSSFITVMPIIWLWHLFQSQFLINGITETRGGGALSTYLEQYPLADVLILEFQFVDLCAFFFFFWMGWAVMSPSSLPLSSLHESGCFPNMSALLVVSRSATAFTGAVSCTLLGDGINTSQFPGTQCFDHSTAWLGEWWCVWGGLTSRQVKHVALNILTGICFKAQQDGNLEFPGNAQWQQKKTIWASNQEGALLSLPAPNKENGMVGGSSFLFILTVQTWYFPVQISAPLPFHPSDPVIQLHTTNQASHCPGLMKIGYLHPGMSFKSLSRHFPEREDVS